ncbi:MULTISPECIES: hypothetical protein [Kribbella]|uniref:hypothetical protein n=1 Tax=Kribbella TaxID=182639 RepID=UPI0031D5C899
MLESIVRRVAPRLSGLDRDQISIDLEVRGAGGRTDLEISVPGEVFVFEAKRGWLLPSVAQLASYAPRIQMRGGGALVTLSQASESLARTQVPAEIDGVPVVHVPWRQVLAHISAVRGSCRGRERMWLDQLDIYLAGVIKVRNVADSWTYCVALNDQRPGGGGALTFREFVTDRLCYFHPYGISGWPTEPPNFIAFRWGGAVRRIHRVIAAEVVPNLLERWPDIPPTEDTVRPHAIYELGPRIPPFEQVPNGAQYRASRLWVLLDQLQTAPTLAQALSQSKALNG